MSEGISSYPKVWNIGHRAIEGIFLGGPVTVQEKLDGSQISFGYLGGDIHVRSKGAVVDYRHPDKMFARAVEQIAERAIDLPPDLIFRGEYLNKAKHNTLTYDNVPEGNIAIFDVQGADGNFVPPEDAAMYASDIGFDIVPTFAIEQVLSVDQLFLYLEAESFLGGPKIEGIVVKRYDKWTTMGQPMFGKYVSEAFKEVHHKDWKERNPGTADVVTNIITMYKTEARWEKAVQHLRERGELDDSPRDIGALIHEVQEDVLVECAAEIRELLFGHFWKKAISRGITAGLPEWYKQRLAASAFEAA